MAVSGIFFLEGHRSTATPLSRKGHCNCSNDGAFLTALRELAALKFFLTCVTTKIAKTVLQAVVFYCKTNT